MFPSMDQTDLLKNYLYSIKQCTKMVVAPVRVPSMDQIDMF